MKKRSYYSIVKRAIDKMDPYCLIEGGAPRDEFNHESRDISSRINEDMSAEDIAIIISDVLTKAFSDTFTMENCLPEAEEIYQQIHKL